MSSCEVHTCVTCRVIFKDNDIQREHYKSDWHRYNLKRKVADLPCVTAEEFNNRVLQQRNKIEESNASTTQYCECCRKSFANENSYNNHLNSKRHHEKLLETKAKPETSNPEPGPKGDVPKEIEEQMSDSDVEEIDSDEWNEDSVSDKQCLFCSHVSRSLIRNLRHMSVQHSFFVPDIEYCINMSGLIMYLNEKVHEGYMCLWCNDRGRSFYSADAAKSHMQDKGHCKMLHEGLALAEYADFYDYSTSYPTVSADPEEEVSVEEIDGSDYQLVLPSGAVVGHRSLMRYYRQKLSGVTPVVAKSDKRLHQVLATYRASGWTVAQQEQVVKRARDIHYMKRLHSKWQIDRKSVV